MTLERARKRNFRLLALTFCRGRMSFNNPKELNYSRAFKFLGKQYTIRPASDQDVEVLRIWKNQHKQHFFHQSDISPEQQKAWFASFKKDPLQQIFVCLFADKRQVACVGFRQTQMRSRETELFNLICGDPELLGTGFITQFFKEHISGLSNKGIRKIHLKVLKSNNRATQWYKKHGFETFAVQKDCFLMKLEILGEMV